ncbi:MAG: formyltransferase [Gammaproteobacteria bacterium]|nr:formyltransferase [Gammaproteobacteria bacterium]
MTCAVVFAYHDVGVRCLRTLLAHRVEVPLVVTHEDSPGEAIWFDSVARHASWHGARVIAPADANVPAVLEQVRAAQPDFLFSFYYRQMLGPGLLAVAARGAYNLHGSLLPKYRGRAPVNWAVLQGERTTGATLHVMTARPDAGAIVAQQAVPILPDDTAVEVFRKVTVAAELLLDRILPALLAGTAEHRLPDLEHGSYCGRRTAADGRIDWCAGARAVHDLVRAVAPPYPGAFATAGGHLLKVWRTLPSARPGAARPLLQWQDGALCALCHDGALRLLEFELDGSIRDAAAFHARFGAAALPLD